MAGTLGSACPRTPRRSRLLAPHCFRLHSLHPPPCPPSAVPATSFGAILRATSLLAAKCKAYIDFFRDARASHGSEYLEDGSRVSTIVDNLQSDYKFSCLLVFNALKAPMAELPTTGQEDIRHLGMRYWGVFEGFVDLLHCYWKDGIAVLEPGGKPRGTAPFFTAVLDAVSLPKKGFEKLLAAACDGIAV